MYMKLIKRTYRFRLYPSDSQKDLIEKTLGCSRHVYNEFLSICKKEYELALHEFEDSKKAEKIKKDIIPNFLRQKGIIKEVSFIE